VDERRTTPALEGVLETVLYYRKEREPEVVRFYVELLGMRIIGRNEGRFLFLRAGGSVLLLFEREAARRQESPPPHGCSGPGHVCFRVPRSAYREWSAHLEASGVHLIEETRWPSGGRSFYFHDPDGNVLEIADRDIWPP
jgi:catechol 2,3-dioxygenase-like lactoylglutathione lyase family enzyme